MTSRDFCYWLQGYFEMGGKGGLTAEQTECIERHLALVFRHEIDPSFGNNEYQKELDKIHSPSPYSGLDTTTTLIRC